MPNAPCNFILVLVYANLVQLFLRKPQTDPDFMRNVRKKARTFFKSGKTGLNTSDGGYIPSEQGLLGMVQVDVLLCGRCRLPALRGAFHKPYLDQVGFVDLFYCPDLLTH